ncbi:MAG: hypothetical protein HZA08_13410 [Nitrospirae bacterium]|nr:hypothetical protein [Nitrospirota bacterium]
MIEKKRAIFPIMLILTAMIINFPSLVFSGEISVRPGKFDHFNILIPEKIVAGEDASITLHAVDSLDNQTLNFGEKEKEFYLAVTGTAAVRPESFKSSLFNNGATTFTLMNKAAENVRLSIMERGNPIPILLRDITVTPGRLNSFKIDAPRAVNAGDKFDIKITAKDSFGNTISDQILGKDINLVFTGDNEPKIEPLTIPDFKNGASVVTLLSKKTGAVAIEAKDLITTSTGISDTIEIVNGPVNTFRLFAPKEVIAGESFDLSIVAVDQFGNVVLNYPVTGNGVNVTLSGKLKGKLKTFPSTVSKFEFAGGQSKVSLRYDPAGDVTITVQEIGGAKRKASEVVRIVPAMPTRFDVFTPESAVAGQRFKIKVTTYNQAGHEIRNYNLFGPDVQLLTTGSGVITPDRIPASEFVNGAAVAEVQYNKSESFTITASPLPPSAKTVVKHNKKKTNAVPPIQPYTNPTSSNGQKMINGQGAKVGAIKNKGKVKKKTLEITDISLVEPSKTSAIKIHIPNIGKASGLDTVTEVNEGKSWIVIKINPAISRLKKPLKFDSSVVGNIILEEDKQNKGTVLVKIEELKPSRYDVKKEKDSLVITFDQ